MRDGQIIVESPVAGDELLIAGDSHITALGVSLMSRDAGHHLCSFPRPGGPILGLVGAWPRQFDAYWDAVQEHATGRTVAILWGGNAHLVHFLFAPTPLFDYVVSTRPDLPLDEASEIIPEEALREFLALPIRPMRSRIEALASVAARVLVVGSPPPKGDDAFIRMRLEKTEPHFQRVAAGMGLNVSEISLSPPILRLKMWMTLQGIMRDLARETGAVFVPVPQAARTEQGFLRLEHYSNDVTHANSAYGDVMLGELRKIVAGTATTAAEQ